MITSSFHRLAWTSRRLAGALLVTAALAGCASDAPRLALFDLGPIHSSIRSSIHSPIRSQQDAPTALPASFPAISLADIQSPAWLDSQAMFYRLDYANDLQPKPYSASKWTMPPAQLFAQRLKSSLTRSGGVVIAAADGAINVPILRLEADDFSQHFESAGKSHGEVAIRASLFDGRILRAQKMFVRQVPAATADAQGGAAALAAASDAVIAEMSAWLATLPPKQ